VDDAPDELSTAAVVITAPPEEFVPDELKGKRAVGLERFTSAIPRRAPQRSGRSRTCSPPSI
jgi:hypothetical protein